MLCFIKFTVLAGLVAASPLPISSSLADHKKIISARAGIPLAREIPRPNGLVNVAYFTSWGSYTPSQVPTESLTHLFYSFGGVKENGEVFLPEVGNSLLKHFDGDVAEDGVNLYGNLKQLYLLKQQNRHLKIMLSIGGWTFKHQFSGPASSADGRAEFVRSSVKLVEDLGFDGVDIDWEYPSTSVQANNYVSLLAELREGLDALASSKGIKTIDGYELTAAVPCGAHDYETLHVKEMDQYLSFWNLMAYDYAGAGWSSHTSHHAALFAPADNPRATSTENAVNWYIANGVEAKKIVVGLPLYGRSFAGTNGIDSPHNGVGSGEGGIHDCRLLPLPGSTEVYDEKIVGAYCHDAVTGEYVTYDTPEGSRRKAAWIIERGLGGAMFWEISGDHAPSTGKAIVPIVATIFSSLDTRSNHLDYKTSIYANLAASMPGSSPAVVAEAVVNGTEIPVVAFEHSDVAPTLVRRDSVTSEESQSLVFIPSSSAPPTAPPFSPAAYATFTYASVVPPNAKIISISAVASPGRPALAEDEEEVTYEETYEVPEGEDCDYYERQEQNARSDATSSPEVPQAPPMTESAAPVVLPVPVVECRPKGIETDSKSTPHDDATIECLPEVVVEPESTAPVSDVVVPVSSDEELHGAEEETHVDEAPVIEESTPVEPSAEDSNNGDGSWNEWQAEGEWKEGSDDGEWKDNSEWESKQEEVVVPAVVSPTPEILVAPIVPLPVVAPVIAIPSPIIPQIQAKVEAAISETPVESAGMSSFAVKKSSVVAFAVVAGLFVFVG